MSPSAPSRRPAPGTPPTSPFLDRLRAPEPLVTVELRPPAAGLDAGESMDVWIDMHHAVQRLTSRGHPVFLTDDAVGAREEENLAHLAANLAAGVDTAHVVPFLTCKHTLEYCLMYAERAWAQGFRSLTVLGGDRKVGAARCVSHAYQLRARIRARVPEMVLGGWANPHADAAAQADYLAAEDAHAEFFLSQVVSHHAAGRVEALVRETERRGVEAPGVFGVFFYRSANPRTLAKLRDFFPVPAEEITREFDAGATPEEVCARSLRALRDAGARHVYVSNLNVRRGAATLARVLARV